MVAGLGEISVIRLESILRVKVVTEDRESVEINSTAVITG